MQKKKENQYDERNTERAIFRKFGIYITTTKSGMNSSPFCAGQNNKNPNWINTTQQKTQTVMFTT